jgi:hypothetical protein
VLSATKELEPGSRAMLLLAEGLFRLDVVISRDTLRTVVRNLSSGSLKLQHGPAPQQEAGSFAFGEIAGYEPSRTQLEFALGAGQDRVTVESVIATLRYAEKGTVRVTAQAIVRHAPAG